MTAEDHKAPGSLDVILLRMYIAWQASRVHHVKLVGRCREEGFVFMDFWMLGGSYNQVTRRYQSPHNFEAHHPLAWAAYRDVLDVSHGRGPAIRMTEKDHEQTAGYDSLPGSEAYRARQSSYLEQGRIGDAWMMDVRDIRVTCKLGDKYDHHLARAEMQLLRLDREKKLQLDENFKREIQERKEIQLVLPTRNLMAKGQKSLTGFVRRSLFDFFCQEVGDGNLIKTLQWIVFEEFEFPGRDDHQLSSCPGCGIRGITLTKREMDESFQWHCPSCQEPIFMTDVFRIHDVVDDELGAGGAVAYVQNLVEQMLIVHYIRVMLLHMPDFLRRVLFIKDGPLAFFGPKANMHVLVRNLMTFLYENHSIFLTGVEKSGMFVDHAHEIAQKLRPGTALMLSSEYIYRYIIHGRAGITQPYGNSTYYGDKVIFKSQASQVYVLTVPTSRARTEPQVLDLFNLDIVLTNVQLLKCDMYNSALIPVALVNKLVSLANYPSSRILQRFAQETYRR